VKPRAPRRGEGRPGAGVRAGRVALPVPPFVLLLGAYVAGMLLAAAWPVTPAAAVVAAAGAAALCAAATLVTAGARAPAPGGRGARAARPGDAALTAALLACLALTGAASLLVRDARDAGTLAGFIDAGRGDGAAAVAVVLRGTAFETGATQAGRWWTVRAEAVRAEAVGAGGASIAAWTPAAGWVRVEHGPAAPVAPGPGPGALVVARGRLQRPLPPGNPGDFDRRLYLAARNVRYVLALSDPGAVTVIGRGRAPAVLRLAWRARAGFQSLFSAALPAGQAALLEGIMFGDAAGIDAADADALRRAGTAHVLSVSGLHVGYVVAACRALAAPLARPAAAAALALPAAAFYILLGGARPAVLRSFVMAAAVLAAPLAGRRAHPLNNLCLAAFVVLTQNPFALWDAGFHLSFGATWGIIAFSAPIAASAALRRLPRPLRAAWATTLAAQAGSAAIVAYHFGRLPLLAPLANLVAGPAAGGAVAAGLLAGAFGLACRAVGRFLAQVAGLAAQCVVWSGRVVGGVAWAAPALRVGAAACLFCCLALVVAAGAWRRPGSLPPLAPQGRAFRPARLVAAALIVALGFVLPRAAAPPGVLRLYVLDAAQGDAELIGLPDGGWALVDGGPAPDRVLAYLDRRGIRRLRLVVLTHPHADHLGGLQAVVEALAVDEVWDGPWPADDPQYAAFRALVERRGIRRVAAAGLSTTLAPGVTLTVVHPAPGAAAAMAAAAMATAETENEGSLALVLRCGHFTAFLAGDLEGAGEAELLQAYGGSASPLRCDVLKVAHHGSARASSDALLAVLAPRVAVVSVGRRNPNHLPDPRALARLRAAGAVVYRTDRDGAVVVSVNPGGGSWGVRATLAQPRFPRIVAK